MSTDMTSNITPSKGFGEWEEDITAGLPDDQPLGARIVEGLILLVISIMTLLGNTLLWVTIIRYEELHRSMYLLILSLSASDLAVGVINMPVTVYTIFVGEWQLGPKMCEITAYTFAVSMGSTVTHLCAISINRYICVCHGKWYATIYQRKFMVLHLAGAWSPPVLNSLTRAFGKERIKYVPDLFWCRWQDQGSRLRFTIFSLLLISQTILTIFCNSAIYCKFRKTLKPVMDSRRPSMAVGSLHAPTPECNCQEKNIPPPNTVRRCQIEAAPDKPGQMMPEGQCPCWVPPFLGPEQPDFKPTRCNKCNKVHCITSDQQTFAMGMKRDKKWRQSAGSVGCTVDATAGMEKKDAEITCQTSCTTETKHAPLGSDTDLDTKTSEDCGFDRQSFLIGPGLLKNTYSEPFVRRASTKRRYSMVAKPRREDVHVTTTLMVVVLMFFITYIPVVVCSILKGKVKIPSAPMIALILLLYFNSMCNPIIYGWGNLHIRNGYKQQMEGLRCRRSE